MAVLCPGLNLWYLYKYGRERQEIERQQDLELELARHEGEGLVILCRSYRNQYDDAVRRGDPEAERYLDMARNQIAGYVEENREQLAGGVARFIERTQWLEFIWTSYLEEEPSTISSIIMRLTGSQDLSEGMHPESEEGRVALCLG